MLEAEVNYLTHLTAGGWIVTPYDEQMPEPPKNRLATLVGWKLKVDSDSFHVRDSSVFGDFDDVKKAVKRHGVNPFPKSPTPVFKDDDVFLELCNTPVKPIKQLAVVV